MNYKEKQALLHRLVAREKRKNEGEYTDNEILNDLRGYIISFVKEAIEPEFIVENYNISLERSYKLQETLFENVSQLVQFNEDKI